MTKSLQEEGLRLIREADAILRRDAQAALAQKDYNLAVRRAQEVVELTLKGALRMLSVDYPKIHDVAPVFSEQLQRKRGKVDSAVLRRIEEISLWLAQSRTASFYFEREYEAEDAEQALEDAAFVATKVREFLDISGR
jgi:HEPN domain-containing protein